MHKFTKYSSILVLFHDIAYNNTDISYFIFIRKGNVKTHEFKK